MLSNIEKTTTLTEEKNTLEKAELIEENQTDLADDKVEDNDAASDCIVDNLDEASFSCDEGTNLERVERLTPKYTSEPNLSFLPSNHEVTPKYTKHRGTKLFCPKVLLPSHVSARKDKKHDILKLQKRYSVDEKNISSDHSINFKSCVKCSSDSSSEADAASMDYKPVAESNEGATSPRSGGNTPRLCRKDSVKYMRNKRTASRASTISPKDESPKDSPNTSKETEFIMDSQVCTPRVNNLFLVKPNYLTSTPAVGSLMMNSERIYEGCSTPMFPSGHIMRRGSMSPITKSTQKMCKAMQV